MIETLAITLYLAEKAGTLVPQDAGRRTAAYMWTAVAATDLGPAFAGQFQFGVREATRNPAAAEWFIGEAQRYLRVLEARLGEAEYLADEYSFADVFTYPMIATSAARLAGGLEPYANLRRWCGAIGERPPVQRGMAAMQGVGL